MNRRSSGAANGGWTPIVSGALEERARRRVERIADDLRGETTAGDLSCGLAQGTSGLALFFAHAGPALGDDRHFDAAQSLLERAIASGTGSLSLWGGMPGVAWLIAHFEREGLVDATAALSGLDERFAAAVDASDVQSRDRHDRLGAVAMYALERSPFPESLAVRIVAAFDREATPVGRHVTWWRPAPRDVVEQFPRGVYDVGAIAGVAGTAAVLTGLRSAGVESDTCARMLRGATGWLIAQRGSDATFPSVIDPVDGTTLPPPRRTMWCRGDLGIIACLWRAATAPESAVEPESAIGMARALSNAISTNDVADPGLCHGAAGVAHVFNRLYQHTGHEAFRAAAVDWLVRTLDLLDRDDSCSDPGFLYGRAGAGLALTAALWSDPPGWDRLLLLSGVED